MKNLVKCLELINITYVILIEIKKERIKLGIFSSKKRYATVSASSVIKPKEKTTVPNLWVKCDDCGEIIYKKDIEKNYKKCPKCDYYFQMGAEERVELLIDEGTFVEYDEDVLSLNPLNFPGYDEKMERAKIKSGLDTAVVTGVGNLHGIKISFSAMDFSFQGGSMGSAVGEKLTRAIERGVDLKIPVVIVSTSGGARMHEGILSLMQMAKTSAALDKLRKAKVPFISIPVSPTTGGVTASFAMLGDVIITEPNALIGFAGPRVVEQTMGEKLPEGLQKSEFLLDHGIVDIISKRENLKDTIAKVLRNLI